MDTFLPQQDMIMVLIYLWDFFGAWNFNSCSSWFQDHNKTSEGPLDTINFESKEENEIFFSQNIYQAV